MPAPVSKSRQPIADKISDTCAALVACAGSEDRLDIGNKVGNKLATGRSGGRTVRQPKKNSTKKAAAKRLQNCIDEKFEFMARKSKSQAGGWRQKALGGAHCGTRHSDNSFTSQISGFFDCANSGFFAALASSQRFAVNSTDCNLEFAAFSDSVGSAVLDPDDCV